MRSGERDLKEGDIEVDIRQGIAVQFGVIEETLFEDENLVEAIKRLCVCSPEKKMLEELYADAKKELSGDDALESYEQLYPPLLDPKNFFRRIQLTERNFPQVRYAIQNKIFELFCEALKEQGVEAQAKQKVWIFNTREILDKRHEGLPKEMLVPANPERAAVYRSLYRSNLRHSCCAKYLPCLVIFVPITALLLEIFALILYESSDQLVAAVARPTKFVCSVLYFFSAIILKSLLPINIKGVKKNLGSIKEVLENRDYLKLFLKAPVLLFHLMASVLVGCGAYLGSRGKWSELGNTGTAIQITMPFFLLFAYISMKDVVRDFIRERETFMRLIVTPYRKMKASLQETLQSITIFAKPPKLTSPDLQQADSASEEEEGLRQRISPTESSAV